MLEFFDSVSAGADLASIFEQGGLNYVINSSIWLILIVLIFVASTVTSTNAGKGIAVVLWFLLLVYWYAVAWEVDWVRWFGVEYIPFINPGALVWIGMAITGYIFSMRFDESPAETESKNSSNTKDVSVVLAIASHLVVGGLLTVQIQNTWTAYNLTFMSVDVFLSLTWMLYALLLFIWGAKSNQKIFRLMGTIVIVVTSLKVFFFDLSKPSTTYIVLLLGFIGIIILTIARVDKYWREKHEENKDNDIVESNS